MKLSEFWTNMDYEFGAGYARVLAGDLVLGSLGNMTALEALEAGVAPKDVWLAARHRIFRRFAVWDPTVNRAGSRIHELLRNKSGLGVVATLYVETLR